MENQPLKTLLLVLALLIVAGALAWFVLPGPSSIKPPTPSGPPPATGYSSRKIDWTGQSGPYDLARVTADFGPSQLPVGRDFGQLANKELRVSFKKAKKVTDTGFSLQVKVPPENAYELEFKIRYPKDFPAGLHGKQFGMSGGRGYDGGRGEEARTQGDGWSVRLQFDALADGIRNSLYVYHADMPAKYGDGLKGGSFLLPRDEWVTIRIRVTLPETLGQPTGRIQVWRNEEPEIDVNTLRLVTQESARQVDTLRFELFPGGGGDFPDKDYEIRVKDISWRPVVPQS